MVLTWYRAVMTPASRHMLLCSRSYSRQIATNLLAARKLISSKAGSFLNQSSIRTMVGWWQRPCSGSISKTCGWNTCCSIHSENDKSLVQFLNEEIKLESDQQKPLPKIKDFTVSTDESNVVLTKTLGDEKITIKFNVNHSVNSAEMVEEEGDDSQMVSKPPFTVELEKAGQTLALSCVFTEDVIDPQGGAHYADTLEIEEVCLHRGEWKDETYAVSASIMDGNLYDHFLTMLEDRGIDEQFVEHLIEYSTRYEHHNYLSFLQNLQRFVNK